MKDGAFDGSVWTNAKKELIAKSPMVNLPYVKHGDLHICQSIACATYVGRQLSMNGKTDEEVCICEQLLCEVMKAFSLRSIRIFTFTDASLADFTVGDGPEKQDSLIGLWPSRKRP